MRRRFPRIVVGLVVLALAIPTAAAATTIWTQGWAVHAVLSDSMAPGIPRGSVVVSEPVDPAKLRPGSIIVFADPQDTARTVVHRVRRVQARAGGVFFETQGDGNSSPDPQLVPARLVRGRVQTRVLGLGGLVDRLSDPVLGAAVIAAALFVFFSSELLGRLGQHRGRLAALRRERDALQRRIEELEARWSVATTSGHRPKPSGRAQVRGRLRARRPQ